MYHRKSNYDSLVFIEALNLLLNNDILFIHFDELDAAGHNFGFLQI